MKVFHHVVILAEIDKDYGLRLYFVPNIIRQCLSWLNLWHHQIKRDFKLYFYLSAEGFACS